MELVTRIRRNTIDVKLINLANNILINRNILRYIPIYPVLNKISLLSAAQWIISLYNFEYWPNNKNINRNSRGIIIDDVLQLPQPEQLLEQLPVAVNPEPAPELQLPDGSVAAAWSIPTVSPIRCSTVRIRSVSSIRRHEPVTARNAVQEVAIRCIRRVPAATPAATVAYDAARWLWPTERWPLRPTDKATATISY